MTQTTPKSIQPEVITVPKSADQVMCDGGHGALGHPSVYYTFSGAQKVVCEYCGRHFVKES